MNRPGDYTGEMPRTPPLDERGIEAMLAGDDCQPELSAFITAVRHAADGPLPAPSPELRELFARGFSTQQQESPAAATGKWRTMKKNTTKWIAGLSLGGKVALGVGMAAAATTGAGSVGVLPGSVQHEFAQTFDVVLPFDVPDPGNPSGPTLGAARQDPILIDSLPAATTVSTVPATTAPPTTVPPVVTTLPPTTVPVTSAPPTTAPASTTTAPPVTAPPTTPPATTAPAPSTTAPAPEGTAAPTVYALSCARSHNWISVLCTWGGANPVGTVNLFLLKFVPGETGPGRAEWIGPSETSYIDVHANVGETYAYRLIAVNANHQTIGMSNLVNVTINPL